MKAKHAILGLVEVSDDLFWDVSNDALLPVKVLRTGKVDFARRRALEAVPEGAEATGGVSLNELGRQVHESAREKGWYEPGKEKSFLESMMLVVAEISEAVEEFRDGHDYNEVYYKFEPIDDDADGAWIEDGVLVTSRIAGNSFEPLTLDNAEAHGYKAKPEGIPIEVADAVIRILDECANRGIDLDEAIRIKTEFNKTRSYRHGGKLA